MPCQDVDRPALAEYVEPELELDLPATPVEDAYDQVGERRVRRIDQSIAKTASVSDIDDQGRPKRRRDAVERINGHSADLTSLCTGIHGLADASLGRNRLLRDPQVEPDSAEDAPDAGWLHDAESMQCGAWPPISGRLPAGHR